MSTARTDMSPVYSGDRIMIRADNCADRHGVDRRSRAAAIDGAKRAYERANGVTLTLTYKRYSETYGFLHRSEFCYHITPR